jgi:hypothetical protein
MTGSHITLGQAGAMPDGLAGRRCRPWGLPQGRSVSAFRIGGKDRNLIDIVKRVGGRQAVPAISTGPVFRMQRPAFAYPSAPPPWLAQWPTESAVQALFAPGIRDYAGRVLSKTPVNRLEWTETSLSAEVGDQRPVWRLADGRWSRSCSCGYKNDRCVHLYLVAKLFFAAARAEGWGAGEQKVEEVPDYHGKPNQFVKKSPDRKIKGGEGESLGVSKPKVEKIPDFHGPKNPDVKKAPKQKVVEGITNFREYMDAKGKIKSPTVTINVKDFPSADSPPADPNNKGGKALPYVGSKMSPKNGLGDEGSIDAWKPKTSPKKDSVETELLKGEKGKGQPQAESISNKSLVELTSYLSKQNKLLIEGEGEADDGIPTITAWASGKIMPDPLETIEYITHLASMNSSLMEQLVRTLKKKKGGMGGLLGKVLDQPESFKELVGHLEGEHGEKHAGSMCRAMADAYNDFMQEHSMTESALSPPIGFDDEGGDEEEDQDEEGDSYSSDDFSGEDEGGFSDEEEGGDEGGFGGNDEGEDFSDEDEEMPSMLPGEHEKDVGDEEPPPELPKRTSKPKRKFSHDHLIGAMAGHKHMLDTMSQHCKQCGSM